MKTQSENIRNLLAQASDLAEQWLSDGMFDNGMTEAEMATEALEFVIRRIK